MMRMLRQVVSCVIDTGATRTPLHGFAYPSRHLIYLGQMWFPIRAIVDVRPSPKLLHQPHFLHLTYPPKKASNFRHFFTFHSFISSKTLFLSNFYTHTSPSCKKNCTFWGGILDQFCTFWGGILDQFCTFWGGILNQFRTFWGGNHCPPHMPIVKLFRVHSNFSSSAATSSIM